MKKTIALLASLFVISSANAQDTTTASQTKLADVGVLLGYGTGAGALSNLNGFTWGATAGVKMSENWGWDVYFSSTKESSGGVDVTAMPIMADLNFYVAAPIQFYVGPRAGVVITKFDAGALGDTSNTDFAAGAQIGTDFWVAESFSIGVNANWNHVFSDPSSGDLWNFVAPLKYWF